MELLEVTLHALLKHFSQADQARAVVHQLMIIGSGIQSGQGP